jgi:hypothetical protein
MDGATFPFVAGCIFFGVGALILSLIQYLFSERAGADGR